MPHSKAFILKNAPHKVDASNKSVGQAFAWHDDELQNEARRSSRLIQPDLSSGWRRIIGYQLHFMKEVGTKE
ncbi:hypothetical protein [Polynucleobacter corsicus]|uniref:hypothetical protein n=1 Tax=Polynucleobacter corsicus TaxID=2081042 RepID=UPI001BFDCBBB|nr:hypothetical protein [Polynucleobacter corsicus]QWE19482.1 hypothetical protein C2747_04500 [Polynucleobacter corsicus]